jgi:carbon monoxide dehydrogenase subunit G
MKLDSNKVIVNATKEDIKAFLSDSNNLIHLLPQDSISDFKSSKEECSFKVQGGIVISLIQDGIEDSKLFLKSGEKSPFPFRLTVNLDEKDSATEGNIHFDGEVNMFLKMMVEKPLKNLFNYMSDKLKERFA